ncbi:MAG: hypothetical protein A2Z83_05435 [Omnitrophica bacterium GWA2_52_8]|nr:MAG: hypothetical protein A2Z83_05435 [Omnitrophica bacterium GWA2_52_8]
MDTERQRLLLHSFPRSEREEIRISAVEHEGKDYIDLRLWFIPDGGNDYVPTKRGLYLPADTCEQLQRGISLLVEHYQKQRHKK